MPSTFLQLAILALPIFSLSFIGPSIWISNFKRKIKRNSELKRKEILESLNVFGSNAERKRFIGFFHPYCNAGGGGERVLWTAIAFLQRTEPDVVSVVYSGDRGVSKEDIINKVKERFDIGLNPSSLCFVFLDSRKLVEESTWPRFTLLGQSIGSIYLAWEALSRFVPDLFIDTMGYAFTFYLVRSLGDIPVAAYVHYPTISTEMLRRVRTRTSWHTNSDSISSSIVLSLAKQLYYQAFMFYYAKSLLNASFLMVNSTWTKHHIDAVLDHGTKTFFMKTINSIVVPILLLGPLQNIPEVPRRATQIVYPPCDTKQMTKFPLKGRKRFVLSLAQFRPEKDHAAQLYSLAELFQLYPEYRAGSLKVTLILMGSSRNADDAARIDKLESLVRELEIHANVEFKINVSYPELLENLSTASIGISTMVDEHFGINVVEFMAAGLIPIVHASGGPLHDIVVPRNEKRTGFHCTNPVTFAEAIHTALSLSPTEDFEIRQRAREHAVERFSEREFERGWETGGWTEWREKLGLKSMRSTS